MSREVREMKRFSIFAFSITSVRMKKNIIFFCMVSVATALLVGGCTGRNDWQTIEGVIWRTTYRIVYQGEASLSDSIMPVLDNVEMSLSPFRASSLISRVNRSETDTADTMLQKVFEISRKVNRASDGRFDPTVAPLVNLWGFGTDTVTRRKVENDSLGFCVARSEIDSALALVGLSDCRIENGRIIKKHPGTTFNFSAVTKGFACDQVAEMLKRNGVKNYLVEIGGEIALGGKNRNGKEWQIQIDAPVESSAAPLHSRLKVITMSQGGVATSGNYRNFHNSGKYGKFGHTIDPVSGYPARTAIVSATVTAPNCGEADAWATACMATPDIDKAIEMIRREPAVEALLVVTEGDSLRIVTSTDCLFQ